MDGKISIKYLQSYIKEKHCDPSQKKDYCIKLMEEVGELAEAVLNDAKATDYDHIKGTIDEEIWDVIYMALGIANLYDIDIEEVIPRKEALSCAKYGHNISFELNK